MTRRQKVVGPLLNVADTDIKSGGDDTDFVQTTGQIDNNFAATVIVDFLEFADISVLHHNLKFNNKIMLNCCNLRFWFLDVLFTKIQIILISNTFVSCINCLKHHNLEKCKFLCNSRSKNFRCKLPFFHFLRNTNERAEIRKTIARFWRKLGHRNLLLKFTDLYQIVKIQVKC